MKPRTEWKSALRRNAGIIGESLLVAAGLSMVLYRVALSYNPKRDLVLVVIVGLLLAPKWLAVLNDCRLAYQSRRTIALVCGLLGAILIWAGTPATDWVWITVVGGYLYLCLALCAARWKEDPRMGAVEDYLHRGYFADRLADIFNNPETAQRIKRVAITGDWGSGKTRVLDLIAHRLTRNGDGKYLIARVNPWKATTAEEAWAAIATEIDRALGYRPWGALLRPKPAIFDSVLGVLPTIGISSDVFKLLSAQGESSQSVLKAKINARLKAAKGKVVVLVDDMERTDPRVLLNLFPIIDQMATIENAAFVFAIDPSKVAEAYGETTRNGQNAKGYLDKVFDLQIELPDLRKEDIYAMLLNEAKKRGAKKLEAALPLLEDYLPTNPRAALRFLEFAVCNEHVFLSRYQPDEKPYAATFLAWLAETEFPGILDAVQEHNQKFIDSTRPTWMGSEVESTETFKEFHEAVCASFGRKHGVIGEAESIRFKNLLEGLCRIPAKTGVSVVNGDFSVKWAKSDYKQLMTMSSQELHECHRRWSESAELRPIKEFLAVAPMAATDDGAEEWEFVDKVECVRQLINFERDRMLARQPDQSASASGDRNHSLGSGGSSLLARHLTVAMEKGWQPEKTIFDGRFLREFLERPEIEEGSDLPAMSEVQDFLFKLVDTIPINSVHGYLVFRRRAGFLSRGLGKMVLNRVLERTRDFVKKCLQESEFDSIVGRGGVAEFDFFMKPYDWLPATTPKEVVDEMRKIVAEADRNEDFAAGCAWVVSEMFLKSANVFDVVKLEKVFPEYVASFWQAAMTLPEDHPKRRPLMDEREAFLRPFATTPEDGYLAYSAEKVFPLPVAT
jgi:hypothetical protein